MMRCSALLAACLVGVLPSDSPADAAASVDSMDKLFAHIESQGGLPSVDGVLASGDAAGPRRTMGFLSEANWHSAKHSLPTNTLTLIANDVDELIAKVGTGEIIGAMIKGVPRDPDSVLNTWPSATITPQAIFLAPGAESRSMTEAVDASLVRMLSKGKAQEARQHNMPNNYIEIHTCKAQEADLGNFPFPPAALVMAGPDSVLKDVLTTRTLKMTEYAATAHSNNCEIKCTCGETATLPPTCTGTPTAAGGDCPADFAAAEDTTLASCAAGCDYYEGTTSAVCHSGFGDSWAPTTKCCDCADNSMTCTEGDDWAQDGDYTTAGIPTTGDRAGKYPGFWPE